MKPLIKTLLLAFIAIQLTSCIAPTQLKLGTHIDPISNDTTLMTNEQPLMAGAVLTELIVSKALLYKKSYSIQLRAYIDPKHGYIYAGDSVAMKLDNGEIVYGYMLNDGKYISRSAGMGISWSLELHLLFRPSDIKRLTRQNLTLIQIKTNSSVYNAVVSPECHNVIRNQLTFLGAMNL